MEIFVYVEPNGRRPFDRWFDRLDPAAATKVRTAIARMELGNLSNAKGVGGGVLEYRIDYGPGYRVYFGRDGDAFVILLGGGIKQRQDEDIAVAQVRWLDYRQRKRELR